MTTPPGTALASLLPLVAWLSPAFPVGSFAYSHGMEAALETGALTVDGLAAWLADLIEHGSIRNDALLLAAAARAATAADAAGLAAVNALALALCAGRERHLETTQMGNAFVGALRAIAPGALPDEFGPGDVAYPVAVGAAAALAGLAVEPALALFGLSVVGTLVSAALRLGLIGQTDGQRATLASLPAVQALAAAAAHASLDAIGGCAFRSDLASLQHETQYSRVFRS